MPERIYLLGSSSQLVTLIEEPYDSESVLQQMLAAHPDLLSGDQIDPVRPRKWLLISREMGVSGGEDRLNRWSVDHLFLDQDAVPTLVEVKKGSNTDLRRKVVGQMMDYAANAIVRWPTDEIRSRLELRCRRENRDLDDVLGGFLDDGQSQEEFWGRVKTNLQAGRIRLIFIADSIPAELRRVVEFLNGQMDPAEVLAIEVKQFVGDGMKTFTPRVFGQTVAAQEKKAGVRREERQWDESSFMTALEQAKGRTVRAATEDLLHWIAPQVSEISWGAGVVNGGFIPVIHGQRNRYQLCRISMIGWFVFRFDWLCEKPPFQEDSFRRELLAKLNDIPGVEFTSQVLTRRARIPLQLLENDLVAGRLKEVLAWMISRIQSADGPQE